MLMKLSPTLMLHIVQTGFARAMNHERKFNGFNQIVARNKMSPD